VRGEKARNRLTEFATGVAENLVARYIALIVPAVLVAGLAGLYTFYSDSPQIVLLWVIIILTLLNSLACVLVLRGQAAASRPRADGMLLRDTHSGTLYLRDMNGRAREIPDDHTSSYLEYALGDLGEMIELSTAEITKLRGEKLMSVRKWERPPTPQEEALDRLRFKVRQVLGVEASFDDASRPQRIKVQISNRGDKPLYLNKVTFQHGTLTETALTHEYPREGIFTVIPLETGASNIVPRSHLVLDLRLSQIWERADIERLRRTWGYLRLDVVWEGQVLDALGYQL